MEWRGITQIIRHIGNVSMEAEQSAVLYVSQPHHGLVVFTIFLVLQGQ